MGSKPNLKADALLRAEPDFNPIVDVGCGPPTLVFDFPLPLLEDGLMNPDESPLVDGSRPTVSGVAFMVILAGSFDVPLRTGRV